MADGARTAGARIVAALLVGPATLRQLVERTGLDVDTVRDWLAALKREGVAVNRGRVRHHGTAWAPVWSLNLEGR